MNKIFYSLCVIFCVIVSIHCDEEETAPREKSVDENILENCEILAGPDYVEKFKLTIRNTSDCLAEKFDETLHKVSSRNYVGFLNEICDSRENYYSCLSYGLDAYSLCLTEEENLILPKVRKVFRRFIAQICSADIQKILEFLGGHGPECYLENHRVIEAHVFSLFKTNKDPHLPSSYINDDTCLNLIELHTAIKPIVNLCEDKSPGNFINNLLNAIEDELSCEQQIYEAFVNLHTPLDNDIEEKSIMIDSM